MFKNSERKKKKMLQYFIVLHHLPNVDFLFVVIDGEV